MAPRPSAVTPGALLSPEAGRVWRTCSVREANAEAVWRLLRGLVFAILLIRASTDPIFNLLGGDSGAASMGVGALFNVLAIAIAGILFLQAPLKAPFPVMAIWGPFLLIAFSSAFQAPDFNAAVRLASVLLTYWAFFAIPFFILRSSRDILLFIQVVFVSSIPPTLYAFVDLAQGLSDLHDFRLQSTFTHPNIYAFYLVLILGLALYIRASGIVRASPRIRMLVTLYIPLLVVLLLLTKTRSAWGACALMFMVYAVGIERRFLFGLLLLPVLFIANPNLMDRVTDVTAAPAIDDFSQLNADTRLNSYAWREALWESVLPRVLEQPLLGHGLETLRPSVPRFFPLVNPPGIDGHNLYLQMSFELGLLGLLALLWLFGCVAWCLARGWRRDPPGVLIIGCLLFGYMLESYSDNMHFYLAFNWYFWFVMGTLWAWIRHDGSTSRFYRRNMLSWTTRERDQVAD
ncbi:O-antigen ligase [uncultured Bosea sp.]|uniref:O-antigen ligase family protein n=1 Tax=uncultured Bosea sp. TaxID=211457 RepID=UPI0025F7EFEF|nr:O-antigen ligase family protein [uncultured Bosea sp.]